MHYRSIASVTIVALATQATARTFTRANQSVRDLGVFRRQSDGYQPEDEVCAGGGETCAEACGAGYDQCSSSDDTVHCFNPAAGESCCSTGTGSSCLAAFVCTHDSDTQTWCCPEGQDLEACAQDFGVTGGLTFDLPEPTSSAVESSEPVPTSSFVAANSTSFEPTSSFETSSVPANSTSHKPTYSAPLPTTTDAPPAPTTVTPPGDDEEEAAGVAHGPAGIAAVAGIALLVALF